MSDSQPVRKPRIYYVDKLRLFLTAIVVVHHCFWVVAAGWFPFYRPWEIDTPTRVISFIVLTADQAYFMGLFFFLSGLVTVPSLRRKGAFQFLKDRLVRLVIPAVLYDLILFPLLFCFLQAAWYQPVWESKSPYDAIAYAVSYASFGDVWSIYYKYILPELIFIGNHMWFTITLFALNVLAVLLITIIKPLNVKLLETTLPTQESIQMPLKNMVKLLHIFAFILFVVNFLLRLACIPDYIWYPVIGNVGFIGQYVVAFTAGILASHHKFLDHVQQSHLKFSLIHSFVFFNLAQIFQTYAPGPIKASIGDYGHMILATLFEQYFALFWSYALLVIFKTYFNGEPSKRVSYFIGAAYSTYIIHQWVVIPIAVGFAYLTLHPLLVIFLLCLTANPSSWICGILLKMIPGSDIIL